MKNILVIQTAFLGDLILAIPLLKNIKKQFPNSSLSLVCRKGLGLFFLNLKLIDSFFEVDKGNSRSYKNLNKILSQLNFDIVFSPHMSIRTALLVRRMRVPDKVGYREFWNSCIFNKRVLRNHRLPDPLRQLNLLSLYSQDLKEKIDQYENENSISLLGPVPEWASLKIDSKLIPEDDQFETQTRPSIILFPGSAWETKRWTQQGFQSLILELQKLNFQVIALGGSDERAWIEGICQGIPNVLNLAGKTSLLQTLSLLKNAKACVANDNGGQHLASMVGTPTVSIFGPTILEFGYRPWNSNIQIVEDRSVRCRPCGKHGHKKCPLGTHECMTKITTGLVLEKLRTLLVQS